MKLQVYFFLVIFMYCTLELQSANGEEKCLLPSERRPQYFLKQRRNGTLSKPNFSSSFPGFTVDNFQTQNTCPGHWEEAPLPQFYQNEKNWICYTLQNFFALKCPYYVCNRPNCNLGSDAPDPNANPRVVYQCQLASFVDVPYYAFCFNMGNLEQYEFVEEKLILPRCCECTKYTCTE